MTTTQEFIDEVIDMLTENFDKLKERLNTVIDEIDKDYKDRKLPIPDEQWLNIIVLVGALSNHEVGMINDYMDRIKQSEAYAGKVKDLISIAVKFRDYDFS
jgi:hypothetical protein